MLFNINKHKIAFDCAIAFFSLVAFGSVVQAQQPSPSPNSTTTNQTTSKSETKEGLLNNFKYVFEAGAQIRDVSGERPSKFEEYQNVRKGFFFRRFTVESNPAGEASFFFLSGRNLAENEDRKSVV